MKVKLSNVRIAFCDALFEPKPFQGTGSPRYGSRFVIEPNSENVKALDAAILAVATEEFKGKAKTILAEIIKKGDCCFSREPYTNSEGEVYDGFEGKFSLGAGQDHTKGKPLVIDRDRTELTNTGRIYAGCYVNASVEVWCQNNKFGKRINAALKGVQFVKDGDAFGGGAPISPDEFDALEEEAAEADPL